MVLPMLHSLMPQLPHGRWKRHLTSDDGTDHKCDGNLPRLTATMTTMMALVLPPPFVWQSSPRMHPRVRSSSSVVHVLSSPRGGGLRWWLPSYVTVGVVCPAAAHTGNVVVVIFLTTRMTYKENGKAVWQLTAKSMLWRGTGGNFSAATACQYVMGSAVIGGQDGGEGGGG